ncbi:SpoIVB peptidase [Acutalibacter sp. 1XD8-36]|nr:SpoIVB peptidase [Acutalibacter sp. 1XD8-36]
MPLLVLPRKRVKHLKCEDNQKFGKKRAFCGALHTFAMSVGITAVCMLATVGVLGLEEPSIEPGVQEAAAFETASQPPEAKAVQKAEDGQVIPLGEAFGIKLFTDGVIVASLSDIYTTGGICCPAAEAGLRAGDYLIEADGMTIGSNSDLAAYIGQSQGQSVTFRVRRGEKEFETTVTPVFGEGAFRTGMWVRDSAAGVGTLTFYDPNTGMFAGLGHGICDADAGSVMTLKTGEPAAITLCGIVKGQRGEPGQLRGYFSSDESMGRLLANNETGVYGTLDSPKEGTPMDVLSRDEVKPGPVEILASIDGSGPRLYSAEIKKVNPADQPTKNLVISVTDKRLLESTGGIVQGMSGAPILQDGKLCGAVTHVFMDDPTMGYGIFAETMLEQCNSSYKQDIEDKEAA